MKDNATLEFDVKKVREDFPILKRKVRGGQNLVYLDSAASALKPNSVIERMDYYYRNETSNVHRGAHFLSEQGTIAYEEARSQVAEFIGAKTSSEIIFTRGTTESINLVAQSFGRSVLKAGDEIILTELEHHSNIVPWQIVAKEKNCTIRVVPISDNGDLDYEAFLKLLNEKTKIVALTWCSNALGIANPIQKYIESAHRVGARVLVDAAQAVSNRVTDVQALDCDFLVFSGHKIFGPYGIGVLYGKMELLELMPPYQGGGSMIAEVRWEETTWAEVPHKFEAGTPAIPEAIGLAAALQYVKTLDLKKIAAHEDLLLNFATKEISEIPGIEIHGLSENKCAIVSFSADWAHASDIGSLLDQQGIAVRAGHHCCQPLMRRLGVPATVRASFSIYNTLEEVAFLRNGLLKAKEFFQ